MIRLKNKITPDTILKNFWKDNQRFADLFNACFFNGDPILDPKTLTEVDTDVSSMLKFDEHAETVKKILDVVKKSAYGVDFVILGIENQAKIHYAMPLRHMIGDAFSYLKEYNEIAKKYKKNKNYGSPDEFLSKMKKADRLHAVLTVCIYYGEKEWDGPRSLIDMLSIPERIKPLISDYKFNLIELRKSQHINFKNEDVNTVFSISRFIYEKNYDKITDIYKEKPISSELAMVIGCITESQSLIDNAIKSDQKGGTLNMCKALEELEEQGRQKGRLEGQLEGRLEGRSQGELCGFIKLILRKIRKNKSFEQIVDELEQEIDVIQPLYDFVKEHIEMSEDELVELYLDSVSV